MRGKAHPICELIQEFRHLFLELGFDEVINPTFVDERDVYMQYGREAPLILDRVFYLAVLEREDIGLSEEKVEKIRRIVPNFKEKERLQQLLRLYKIGKIESEDFAERLAKTFSLTQQEAFKIVEEVFPSLHKPVPTQRTLRSHMTALWYKTLSSIWRQKEQPIKLFSIGKRYRREQRQDDVHLFESTSASCVVLDKRFSMKEGEELASKILQRLGFPKFFFRKKEVGSNYYEEGTDTEVFVCTQRGDVEVANMGFYSSESLKNYRIQAPVFNLGFGVERLGMLRYSADDIRIFVYPQFYKERMIADKRMASMLAPVLSPKTDEGRVLARTIEERLLQQKERVGPTRVSLYKGPFLGDWIEIEAFNWDEGKKLLSFAAENKIYVWDGNILGLPPEGEQFQVAREEGVKTNLSIISLICEGFVAKLEQERASMSVKWKIAKSARQINLFLPKQLYDYINSHNKRIMVGGPLFFGLSASIKRKEDMMEKRVGKVTDYFAKIGVIALEVEEPIRVGDRIHIKGHTTDFLQTVESMQLEHQPIEEAKVGQTVGVKVQERARKGDIVYKVEEEDEDKEV